MGFGIWYGMASWFILLKLFDASIFSNLSWWITLILIAYPSITKYINSQH